MGRTVEPGCCLFLCHPALSSGPQRGSGPPQRQHGPSPFTDSLRSSVHLATGETRGDAPLRGLGSKLPSCTQSQPWGWLLSYDPHGLEVCANTARSIAIGINRTGALASSAGSLETGWIYNRYRCSRRSEDESESSGWSSSVLVSLGSRRLRGLAMSGTTDTTTSAVESFEDEKKLDEARVDCIGCGHEGVDIELDARTPGWDVTCPGCGQEGEMIVTPGFSAIEAGDFRLNARAVGLARSDDFEYNDGAEVL